MLVRHLPFFRSQLFLVFTVIAVILVGLPAYAEGPTEKSFTTNFLEKSEGQRTWWYMGTFTALGHLVSQSDVEQGDCVYNWYFQNSSKQQTLIEETMRKYPNHSPSGVILALLHRDCGKFTITTTNGN